MSTAIRPVSRVLVIGLDGATYDVLTPLAESGRMPNLARMMATSSLSVVNSTRPFITPAAWTTFQTGCDPGQHGIFDYRYLDHRQRRLLLNHTGRVDCPTLFEAVSARGGEVVSLNLPMTYPAPARVRGLVVGGLDSPSIEAALAPYPEFAARMRASGAQYDIATVWRQRPATFEELSAGVERTQAAFRAQVTAVRIANQMTDWRLLVVQFQELDALQHRCWHLLGIDPQQQAPQAWVDKLGEALTTLDDCLGELMELAARRQAAVVALSDHGFGPFREKITLPALLASRGLLQIPGWRGGASYHLRRGGWKLHKLLWRRFRPGMSTAQLTRPLDSLLPIDWRRSRALALHGSLGGLVYLNTRSRFGAGPIETSGQHEQALAETSAAFSEARRPVTGEPLFSEVFSTAERFQCDPVERMWPDLIAIPAPGFHTRHKFDAQPQLLRADASLTGTHRLEGVLLLHAPGLTGGAGVTAELRDVAPTILRLLGIAAPSQMQGRVLCEILDAPAGLANVQAPTLRPALRSAGIHDAGINDADQATVEARLRDLGYLD